ncbi:MAG: ATP-binding protein [Desulfococcaceae bacterium]
MGGTILNKVFQINKKDFVHAGEASIHAKNLLKSLNMDPGLIRRLSICGYEGEMNVVMHGGAGYLSICIEKDRIVLELSDNGPGIPDIGLAMQEGYSTASDNFREMGFGAGMGLPNMKKNADEFELSSRAGMGTKVRMAFFLKSKGG